MHAKHLKKILQPKGKEFTVSLTSADVDMPVDRLANPLYRKRQPARKPSKIDLRAPKVDQDNMAGAEKDESPKRHNESP
jgi:hypothetical protein